MATTTMPGPPQRMVAKHRGKLLLAAALVVVLLAVILVTVVLPQWPFREAAMRQRIEHTTNSSAQIGHYHQIFFPHPGCVLENITLTPNDPSHPKIQIKTLRIRGLYWGFFGKTKHLKSLSFDGLQLLFPGKQAAEPQKPSNPALTNDTRFDEIYAKNSQVVFAADGPHSEPRRYDIYQLVLENFAENAAIHFSSQLKIPQPQANVEISGTFGPIQREDLGASPLAGKFAMKDADLATFHALFGTLNANGGFNGKLGALQVNGVTDAANFGLTDTGHSLPLHTEFSALVNATNGDVKFEPVHVVLGKSKIVATGELASTADKKHAVALELASNDARIQDLMQLFVDAKAPLAGATQFDMKVQLPPGSETFEKRIEVQAHFGIERSRFTHSNTEEKISDLSEKAQGNPKDDDPPAAVTNLFGDVALQNGVAHFSRLDCSVPGADARLHGTYNLVNHAIDLHGTLHTSVKLSQATTGFKAFLMKVVESAKHKKKEGATVPVKITGTYEKPDFGLDATAEK